MCEMTDDELFECTDITYHLQDMAVLGQFCAAAQQIGGLACVYAAKKWPGVEQVHPPSVCRGPTSMATPGHTQTDLGFPVHSASGCAIS